MKQTTLEDLYYGNISGFKLGAKIMTEVYNGRSTTFRET